ncbi:uncharacterized protein LOC131955935 [Physella acuta]|uniref:uncharacterized protein LOC131955935 n=1 Tax=Physella acuta TaxID=109671 RepID=UPI0027DBF79E|nr:uncharacterized protein LOC131955935 [Physella acuta]
MAKFSCMKQFDALEFFTYQRCIEKIYAATPESDKEAVCSSLLEHKYADITIAFLKEGKLLETESPDFSLSLIRDMLSLLAAGSHFSRAFALRLAQSDVITTLTHFLILHTDSKNTTFRWISKELIIILYQMAFKRQARQYFTRVNIEDTIAGIQFDDLVLSIVSKLLYVLLVDKSTAETDITRNIKVNLKDEIKTAVKVFDQLESGFEMSDILDGVAKYAKHEPELQEVNEVLFYA